MLRRILTFISFLNLKFFSYWVQIIHKIVYHDFSSKSLFKINEAGGSMPDEVKEMMGLLPGRSSKEGIAYFTV